MQYMSNPLYDAWSVQRIKATPNEKSSSWVVEYRFFKYNEKKEKIYDTQTLTNAEMDEMCRWRPGIGAYLFRARVSRQWTDLSGDDKQIIKERGMEFGPYPAGDHFLWVRLRYDDCCGNGYNNFAITGETWEGRTRNNRTERGLISCGCVHDEIRSHAPHLAHLIQWHGCGDVGPTHYIANTIYWVKEGNLKNARSSACWPYAGLQDLGDEEALIQRLPIVMAQFHAAMMEYFPHNWTPIQRKEA